MKKHHSVSSLNGDQIDEEENVKKFKIVALITVTVVQS